MQLVRIKTTKGEPARKVPKLRKVLGRTINATEIEQQLEQMSGDPFRTLLAAVLENAPTPEAISALAGKNPDRYGQLLAIVARLAGYTEKLQVEANVNHHIKNLSDAEPLQRLAELAEKPSA